MHWVASNNSEFTTALTDALLALECVVLALWLWRNSSMARVRRKIWCLIFALMSCSALLGAIAHGLQISSALHAALWMLLYFSLGQLMALFLVAALYDWRGIAVAKRWLPWCVLVAVIFFCITQLFSDAFIVFVVYEVVFLLVALLIYCRLAIVEIRSGAAIIAASILVNLIAGAIQTSAWQFTCVLTFDHNSIFHMVQMLGTGLLAYGIHLSAIR